MKRIMLLAVLAILGFACAVEAGAAGNRQVIQKATLKNGSILYGYVQNNDGYGNLVFHSDSAVIYLHDVVADITDRTVAYGQLSERWQQWATRNDALMGPLTDRSMVLSDITIRSIGSQNNGQRDSVLSANSHFINQMKMKLITNVKVVERGVKYKYIEMSENTYSISWNDIVSIQAPARPKTALSGMNRICQTASGLTFTGQYAGETKTTMGLYLSDGVIQTINKNEVTKCSYVPLSNEQNLFEQSELLDVVTTGDKGRITGIVIEQNYGNDKGAGNYILIQQETGTIQSIKLSDIRSISKEYNPRFAPEYDLLLKVGEVYVEEDSCKRVGVKHEKGVYTLSEFAPVTLEKGRNNLTTAKVQYSAAVVGNNVEAFRLVPLKIQKKGKKTLYTFTDTAMVETVYRPVSIGTSVNGTTKAVYQLNGDGAFVLYDPKTKSAYSILVK